MCVGGGGFRGVIFLYQNLHSLVIMAEIMPKFMLSCRLKDSVFEEYIFFFVGKPFCVLIREAGRHYQEFHVRLFLNSARKPVFVVCGFCFLHHSSDFFRPYYAVYITLLGSDSSFKRSLIKFLLVSVLP